MRECLIEVDLACFFLGEIIPVWLAVAAFFDPDGDSTILFAGDGEYILFLFCFVWLNISFT